MIIFKNIYSRIIFCKLFGFNNFKIIIYLNKIFSSKDDNLFLKYKTYEQIEYR